jgi:glycolate oxidase iron-sulfur subunit
MAARLQRRKINNIISTGADVVVTSNPGCLLQIQSGLKKAGAKVRVIHIADFLATGLSVPPTD